MRREVRVQEVQNGYIISGLGVPQETEVYHTLDEVFTRLLSYFEWRTEDGREDRFGAVTVWREKK